MLETIDEETPLVEYEAPLGENRLNGALIANPTVDDEVEGAMLPKEQEVVLAVTHKAAPWYLIGAALLYGVASVQEDDQDSTQDADLDSTSYITSLYWPLAHLWLTALCFLPFWRDIPRRKGYQDIGVETVNSTSDSSSKYFYQRSLELALYG